MKKIILASSSPRRRELLENFGLNFDVISSSANEDTKDDESPEQIVMALAFQKASDIFSRVNESAIIIAADTIVYKEKVLGKPLDYNDAFAMLKSLQGTIHYVYSGLAVFESNSNKKIITYEKTMVKLKDLTDNKIKRYIDSGEVWDKAGAYAIQGIGGALVEFINGDYYNVVGLPISKLDDILFRHFDISLL